MAKNIEIKARLRDLSRFGQKVRELNARLEGRDLQTDTFFEVKNGRLKLRESTLYGNLLIPYLRKDAAGPERSSYALIKIEDAEAVKSLLTQILDVKVVVKKQRDIYIHENVRIHIDDVESIGHFFEFEAVLDEKESGAENQQKVDRLLDYFEIDRADLIDKAYADLILEKRRRVGVEK